MFTEQTDFFDSLKVIHVNEEKKKRIAQWTLFLENLCDATPDFFRKAYYSNVALCSTFFSFRFCNFFFTNYKIYLNLKKLDSLHFFTGFAKSLSSKLFREFVKTNHESIHAIINCTERGKIKET